MNSPNGNARLNPDLQEAHRFLQAMGRNSQQEITFQTFADGDDKDGCPAIIRHGKLSQHAAELTKLNRQGCGIFWTVNGTDGKGRTAKNVTQVRAAFVDLDGAPLQPILDCHLKPHVIVESSPGRYHAYWRVSDCPLERFKAIQRALIAKFNSDPACCDLPRVMRLPGFWHLKGEPFQTRILEIRHA
jgi:hypothetical protein